MTLSLPPFTRAVIWLLAANTAVFLLLELFSMALPDIVRWVFDYLSLQPQQVVLHGWIWQLVTYSFIHAGFWHWFGNMIGIWMFGSAFEGSWGTRRFLELYSFGVIGAALTTIVLSFAHALGRPYSITVGASGVVFAILIAVGMRMANTPPEAPTVMESGRPRAWAKDSTIVVSAAPMTPNEYSSRKRRVPQEPSKAEPNIQMPIMFPNQCQKPA